MKENINQELALNEICLDNITFEKAINAKAAATRLMKYLVKQKFMITMIAITVLISTALMLAAPLVIGKAIDLLYNGIKASIASGVRFSVDISTMGAIIGILLLIYLFTSLFMYIGQYLMAGVARKLTLELTNEISGKLNRLPLKYYDSHKKGDILSRVTNDMERIADSLQDGLIQLISSVITIVAAIIIMLTISPILTLIVVLLIIASILVTIEISHKTESCFAVNQQTLGTLNSTIEEAFTGHLIIKAFGKEKDSMETFNKINESLCDTTRKAYFSVYVISPVTHFLGALAYVVVAVAGGIFIVQGTVTLGNIQAFIQYVTMCSEPMTEAAYVYNMFQSAVASAERIFGFLDEPEEAQDQPNCIVLENPRGQVAFENVKFGYRNDVAMMENINIYVNSGDKIAIVGPTGAGKTTLVNLLMRFYELQNGRITVDGVNIKDMNRGPLRKIFGMVLQDTWLFHGTIQDNIAYGCLDADLDEVILAAKAACADHFIRTLPQGYQTIINEEGANISQGQRQLLTIARAILSNPSILILDEATSSVDTRTEVEIQKAIENLMQGRTSFVIAHRLSTIRDADLILVMQNGTILEQGKHQELMARKGFYEQLFNSQFTNR